ncbi:hypothetical protein WA158_002063 [Blastocystis sp. Blastoise]
MFNNNKHTSMRTLFAFICGLIIGFIVAYQSFILNLSKANYNQFDPENERKLYSKTKINHKFPRSSFVDYLDNMEQLKNEELLTSDSTIREWVNTNLNNLETTKSFVNYTSPRLNTCLDSLNNLKHKDIFVDELLTYKKDINDINQYQKSLEGERGGLQWWRREWETENYAISSRYQQDIYIMNLKLNEFGWEFLEENHTLIRIDPLVNEDIEAIITDYQEKKNGMHKGWNNRELMDKNICEFESENNSDASSVYNRIINSKEHWRSPSSTLWSDSTLWYKNQEYMSTNDETPKPYNWESDITISILITHPHNKPKNLIKQLKMLSEQIKIIPVDIGKNYTDNGGKAVFEALLKVKTDYVLLIDHTVTFNKYTRIDLLAQILSLGIVHVISGSEEDQDHVLTPKCYKFVNKFGKMTHMYGYHDTFHYSAYEEYSIINLAGQVCYRAFYMDIKGVYTFGSVPYVTFNHVISDDNTIYKPLQKLDRSIRESFGQEYHISIYIDTENRFTWMPYLPKDYRSRNNLWTPSVKGMVNPLYLIGSHHDFLVSLDRLFHELNIPYVPIAGSLLSGIAFGGLFPWEYDSDYRLLETPPKVPAESLSRQIHARHLKSVNKTHISNKNKSYLQNRTESLNSNNTLIYPGGYCSLLRDLQPYLQQKLNLSTYVLNFLAHTSDTCGRLTRGDLWTGYADIYGYYHPTYLNGNMKSLGPFKKIRYLGHLVNIPSNWREHLEMDYGSDYYRSNLANTESSPWPICPDIYRGHPSCLKNNQDIYEYIHELTDEVRYWPEVN